MSEGIMPPEALEAAKSFESTKSAEAKEKPEVFPVRDETGGKIEIYKECMGLEENLRIDRLTREPAMGAILRLEKPGTFSIAYRRVEAFKGTKATPETIHLERQTKAQTDAAAIEGAVEEDMRGYLPPDTLEKLGLPPHTEQKSQPKWPNAQPS